MEDAFEHQQWKPVVLSKLVTKENKERIVTKSVPKVENVPLDFDEKQIKYFTPQMGKKIALLRTQKQWNQQQLAEKLGIPKNTMASIENGKELYKGQIVAKLKRNDIFGPFTW
jgi:DNA-binding XRE family transcriptional regulator